MCTVEDVIGCVGVIVEEGFDHAEHGESSGLHSLQGQ